MKIIDKLKITFHNYDETIKNYLAKTLGNNGLQYSKSQIFSIIFEGIKNVMQNVMLYIEDAFTEQNIDTAYRKSSIYSLAKISGYEPYYGSAASGLLECSINQSSVSNTTNKVYIRNNTRIINNNTGYSYIIDIPSDFLVIDLDKPLKKTQVKIVQGTVIKSSYVSIGEPLETVRITTNGLYDRNYIEVEVDGKKYSVAACLYDMYENSEECVVTTGYENELDIMFGNGVHGKQLKEGQTITIKYISHIGESGNISVNDKPDFEFRDSIYDVNGNILNNINFISLKPITSISGGAEADNIETVRKMIGYSSRSMVIATEENFKLFFKRFSFIGQSNIWCDENSLEINAICLGNYNDNINYLAKPNDILLTSYQKQLIKDTLNNSNKAFAGITLNFIDPIIYKYGIICYVKIPNNMERTLIKSNIHNAIVKYFTELEPNTSYIAKSDIITYVLNNVQYIESLDIDIISDADENGYKTGYYYEYVKNNITNRYIKIKKIYDGTKLGLDNFGNIKIDSKFIVPVLSNDITYCSDRKSKNTSMTINATQIYFI